MNTMAAVLTIASAMLGQQGGGAINMAVVNLPVVSERYQKTSDLEAQFERRRAELNEQRNALQSKIEKLQRSLQEEIKPGTEAFDQRRRELAMAESELQWFVEFEGKKVERGLAESLRSIYGDIQATVAEIAKERKYDVVLASDQLPAQAPVAANQVRQQILLQKVIYWSPGVDITDEVVARLNAKYQKRPS